MVTHPSTGRRCWFNQVAFLSQWTLDPDVREFLVEEYGVDGLPFNTWYGDGSPVEEDVVTTINAVYESGDPSRALAGRRRDGDRQRPDRPQPRALHRPARGRWSAFAEPTEVAR